MATDAPTASPGESANLASALTQRLARYFKVQVEDWCDVCRHSVAWEDRHFADQLSPDALDEHARSLDELEREGKFLGQAMQTAGFSDQATAALVAMTFQDLKDRRSLWHGKLKPQQREAILEVF